jgi:hypothetical protein
MIKVIVNNQFFPGSELIVTPYVGYFCEPVMGPAVKMKIRRVVCMIGFPHSKEISRNFSDNVQNARESHDREGRPNMRMAGLIVYNFRQRAKKHAG